MKNKLNVLYDASELINGAESTAARSGIYFVVYNILVELLKRDNINLFVYSNTKNFHYTQNVIRNDEKLKNAKIIKYSKLDEKIANLEKLKFLNKANKESKIKRVAIKIVLLALKVFAEISLRLDFNNPYKKVYKDIDVFFSPIKAIPRHVRSIKRIKKYTILYDVIPIVFPENYPDFQNKDTWFYKLIHSLNKDDYYFAISDYTKKDFIKYVKNITPEHITPIPLSLGNPYKPVLDVAKINQVKEKYNIPKDKKYLFSLCTVEPRKNLIFAVENFIEFIKRNNIDDFVFVLGGAQWEHFVEKLNDRINDLKGYEDKIIKIGYVDDNDMSALYSGAEMFVSPSLYEGFGIPLLESMSCGCPVITSNVSSMPEVIGDAGIQINPTDNEDLIKAFEKMYFDSEFRSQCIQKGYERAKLFTWEKTVNCIINEFCKNAQICLEDKKQLYIPPKNNVAYTIVSMNYLGQALTSFSSFKKYDNPNYDYKIFIMDMIQSKKDVEAISNLKNSGIDINFWSEVKTTIPDVDYEDMLFRYDVIEMNTAIKPYLMEHLYLSGYKKVIYFDPDTYFYQPINELDKLLDDNDIILTPHTLEPIPNDGNRLNSIDIIRTGVFNCGFIATKSSDNTKKMYKFWQENLFDKCYAKQDEGMFTDQIWSQWFPCLFDKVLILKDKGYNGAYWNLHERLPEFKDNVWYIGGDKLVFYHFSGFNPNEKDISKYQTRFKQQDLPADYTRLAEEYANDLLKNNYLFYKEKKYYFDKFLPKGYYPSKLKHRRLLAELFYDKNVNPFLNDAKNKLKIKFKNQQKIREKLLLLLRIKFNLFKDNLTNIFNKDKKDETGVNIIGYIESLHSIGHIARLFINKNYSTGIPYTINNLSNEPDKELETEVKKYKKYYAKQGLYKRNQFFVNADQIPNVVKKYIKRNKTKNTYNSAVWFWEFETGLEQFSDAFKYLDEVIVFSDFLAEVVKNIAPAKIKVTKTKCPFYRDWSNLSASETARSEYGINKNDFVYFFNFDFNSSYNRKNPEAVVRAFAAALKGANDAKVLIKTTNAAGYEDNIRKFNNLLSELDINDKVIFVDKKLERNSMISLINASDAYISLHRGEGFGLGILEAMSLAKPVIVTNYSGNTEFCKEENSMLVDYKLVDCTDDFGPYKAVKQWAEPNIDTATKYMRKLYEDRNFAADLGQKAKQFVDEYYGVEPFIHDVYGFILNK